MAGRRRCAVVAAMVVAALGLSHVAAAQPDRGGRGRGGPPAMGAPDGPVAPLEIQRLFDAYIVMQAQQELQLTDEQFPRFLARVRTLQDVRRRAQMERIRVLQELRRLSREPAGAQDDAMRSQLKALTELEGRQFAELRQAVEGVDQVLDLRQQARFRLFEEQMERRKVELMMRARQGSRPRVVPPQP